MHRGPRPARPGDELSAELKILTGRRKDLSCDRKRAEANPVAASQETQSRRKPELPATDRATSRDRERRSGRGQRCIRSFWQHSKCERHRKRAGNEERCPEWFIGD